MAKKIDAGEVKLGSLVKKRGWLHAPFFQRRYCWDKPLIRDYLSDISDLTDNPGEIHFIGAIVLHPAKSDAGEADSVHWVIDGQQRLTTSMLIVAALKSLHPKSKSINETLDEWTLEANSGKTFKILPTFRDRNQLKSIIAKANLDEYVVLEPGGEKGGELLAAYDYIYSYLKDEPILQHEKDRAGLLRALKTQLIAVEILTDKNMDSTQIFQSINGKIQRLRTMDLVRSFLAMTFSVEEAEKAETFFSSRWLPFEESVGPEVDLLEDYLFVFALQQRNRPSKKLLYPFLRRHWSEGVDEESGKSIPAKSAVEILEELEEYVEAYNCLVKGVYPDSLKRKPFKDFRGQLDLLRAFDPPGVSRSYLVRLIHEALAGNITPAQAEGALSIITGFLVRRAAVGFEPTGLHALFRGLWDSVQARESDIVDEIQRRKTIQAPTDSLIREDVERGDFYGNRKCRFFLYEWELSRPRRRKGFKELLEDGHIDHIMPQSADTTAWANIGTPEERARVMNLLGNLVLIEHEENTSKGAETWDQVRERYANETRAKAAQALIYQTKRDGEKTTKPVKSWDIASIEKRTGEMADWICETWPDRINTQ
jgi:hypothetical protein